MRKRVPQSAPRSVKRSVRLTAKTDAMIQELLDVMYEKNPRLIISRSQVLERAAATYLQRTDHTPSQVESELRWFWANGYVQPEPSKATAEAPTTEQK